MKFVVILGLFISFTLAVRVDIPDPDLCLSQFGYIAGSELGEDCCTFIFCDDPELNKTGLVGKCYDGTAWNQDLLTCDLAKYVPDCDVGSCDVPNIQELECESPQPTDTTCCVGQNLEEGIFGVKPMYSKGDGPAQYIQDGMREFQECPLDEVFDLEACACVQVFEEIPPCDNHDHFLFADEFDPCCSFVQCFQNRTGFTSGRCIAPSTWNDEEKTCDSSGAIMECMGVFCEDANTDPPCNPFPFVEGAECCRAGNWYETLEYEEDPEHPIQYVIVEGPANTTRSECCPMDMDGFQMWFNSDPDVCCCESLVV
ncbi:unnamed protein product [Owenia fusiformis]|uniref:Uncharacterized protein n=1 Tax=Owenia fusiformis TaxID=6347 RepID=A0A8J1TTN6_OWEFU|nr:unnamed protein product [Owenia fusiformis]